MVTAVIEPVPVPPWPPPPAPPEPPTDPRAAEHGAPRPAAGPGKPGPKPTDPGRGAR